MFFFPFQLLLFLGLYRSFTKYEWGGGGGGKSRERLLPRSVVVTAKWVVSCTRITCIQPLSRCSLTFPASSFFSVSVCLFLLSLFSLSSLPPYVFRFYLWLIGQFVTAVSLPD